MKVDMVADMKVDKVANMKVDMVADMKVDKVADMVQRWKKRQALQTCLCYFPQLVLIFRPRARKTMCEECFTHSIISTRALNTSASSAFFMLFTDFS